MVKHCFGLLAGLLALGMGSGEALAQGSSGRKVTPQDRLIKSATAPQVRPQTNYRYKPATTGSATTNRRSAPQKINRSSSYTKARVNKSSSNRPIQTTNPYNGRTTIQPIKKPNYPNGQRGYMYNDNFPQGRSLGSRGNVEGFSYDENAPVTAGDGTRARPTASQDGPYEVWYYRVGHRDHPRLYHSYQSPTSARRVLNWLNTYPEYRAYIITSQDR
jgi:hypothetical protein